MKRPMMTPGDAINARGEVAPKSARAQLCKVWAPIVAVLLLLDVTFNLYFWKIPKLTGWWQDRGYQFLYDVHRLSQPKSPGSVRVLAFGSSVAASFDPYQVQDLLEAAELPVEVETRRILMAGTKPSDFRLFFDSEGASVQPQIAIALVNLVDFLNPSFEQGKRLAVRNVLPPWPTLLEQYSHISTSSEKLDLLLASVSNLYRYRNLARSCIQDHVKLALRWLRASANTGGYGFYPDGYAKRYFGLPVNDVDSVDLEYYIHPEWIRQRGQVNLSFSANGSVLAKRVETDPGWRKIHLEVPPGGDHLLNVVADSAWNPRAAGLSDDVRLLGLRLRPEPPLSARDSNAPPLHYPPVDGREYYPLLRMGKAVGAEFIERWEQTLAADTPFATRFRAYQREKLDIRERAFTPDGEYAELERLVANFSRHGIAVVLVSTPENPLILDAYEDSSYYRSHLQFLRDLEARYQGVRFRDLASALPAEDFNDWHHPNYMGRIKLGPVYAQVVREALGELGAHRQPAT